ncbi:hypothetical protein FZ103_00305 [Streptomonospora sp. PA3]|uniref:hypothetical protein n=1 Tax=Streptomonospora sp. PA3 TaxID=2607326 RepID=UPI0012DD687D|nr:hypothetical protein [Streptomonospora sp. PA3]MUL39635.1 hypothetical protein [Streptomonospora sp. PA3]
MSLNVGELYASLDVRDEGYTRGLTGAVAEAAAAADKIEDEFEDAGLDAGDKFTVGLDGKLRNSRGQFVATGKDAASGVAGAFGTAAQTISGNWITMLLAVVASIGMLPIAGAVAATGITAAFGLGIAGVGIAAAAQSKKVKDSFSDLKENVVSDLKDMAEPLEDTLVDVSGDLQELFDSLSPHLEQAFEDMAPVLSDFSDQLLGAFENFGPTIDGATAAFNELLKAVGPELDESLGEIADSLEELFKIVEENPEIFGDLILGALSFVNGLIQVISWLAQAHIAMDAAAKKMGGAIKGFLNDPVEAFKVGIRSMKIVAAAQMDEIEAAIDAAWDRVEDATVGAWRRVPHVVDSALQAALWVARTLPGKFVGVGQDIVGGIIDGIVGAAGAIGSTLRSIAADALAQARSALDIASPSGEFKRHVGEPIAAGIGAGIESGRTDLMGRVSTLAGDLVAPARERVQRYAPAGGHGRGGINVEHLEVKTVSGEFSTRQVLRDVAWQLAT